MNAVKGKLPALVDEELAMANQEHPAFHSMHEGYAVLLEEIEEAKDALDEVVVCHHMMWESIKKDCIPKAFIYAERVENYAVHLAAEAIQVAAMAQKFRE